MNTSDTNMQSYWDTYYNHPAHDALSKPSQFSVFVAGELEGEKHIVDLGCGNGRDSLFFSHLGHHVLGVDASSSAIRMCTQKAQSTGSRARFACMKAHELAFNELSPDEKNPPVIYARFFLHAIPIEEETLLFRQFGLLCGAGTSLYLEFRTIQDCDRKKETENHFRRFLNPDETVAGLVASGFEISYYTAGFGYAKYKNDDAHVARIIAVKSAAAGG